MKFFAREPEPGLYDDFRTIVVELERVKAENRKLAGIKTRPVPERPKVAQESVAQSDPSK